MQGNKSSLYKLNGVIRNYDWGGTEFLSKMLSRPNPEKKPMAEYWLGAHDSAPSILVDGRSEIALNRFVEQHKEEILGKTISSKFGRLPYLLKILDVKDMLSIQVHPSKHEAEVEFARENKEGIPIDAPNRNYKDNNHKPELMVALGDFWLLHGFKPVDVLRATLQNVPELKPLLEIFDATGYDQLYKTVMEMPQESVNKLLQPLLSRIVPQYENNELKKDQEDFWAARAAVTFNQAADSDRGIFSIYFFNLLKLKEGEGIFQDAGILHAYLEGQNVEIMANSDNVLRGGLTNKHIDVIELMKHVSFKETIPVILLPQKTNGDEEKYKAPAPDFKLSRFKLEASHDTFFQSATAEILLNIGGEIWISGGEEELQLQRGEAAFLGYGQQVLVKAKKNTTVYRASVPVQGSV